MFIFMFILNFIIIIIIWPTGTKPVGVNMKTKRCSNGCNDISFGCQCVLEGDRIPFLKNHGQALKQECSLPGLFCDTGDAPANLLCELSGHDIPCASLWLSFIVILFLCVFAVASMRINVFIMTPSCLYK